MTDRIVLVDDDQNILTSVTLTLESEGFEVDCYNDGEAALAGLGRRPANLGVFDVKMPRMDGIELLQKVRGQSLMPVIFLTSKDDELDEALGLGVGADEPNIQTKLSNASLEYNFLIASLCSVLT